jgi:cytochrome c peroxidase
MYYLDLLNKKWVLKVWDGPAQFIDSETQTFMMLPTDMALLCDPAFRTHLDRYAADTNNFSVEFAAAFGKLLALGTKA